MHSDFGSIFFYSGIVATIRRTTVRGAVAIDLAPNGITKPNGIPFGPKLIINKSKLVSKQDSENISANSDDREGKDLTLSVREAGISRHNGGPIEGPP